ncbi:MAG: phytoene desaturase family protein [Gemmatimonadaceae bacterium]
MPPTPTERGATSRAGRQAPAARATAAPDAIIVGAGIAGLTAGALLARAGWRVEVHEQHVAPGGYATTFERRGSDAEWHRFDVSLHSIGGLGEGGLVRANLERCGAWEELAPIRLASQYRWRTPDEDLVVPQGCGDGYVAALSGGSADDAADLRAFIAEVACTMGQYRRLQGTAFTGLRSTPAAYDRVIRYSRTTQAQLLAQWIRNPRVRDRIASQWAYHGAPPSRLPAIAFMVAWAEYTVGGAWYLGGRGESLPRALVRRIEEAGGGVTLRSRVTEIVARQGRCVGIRLADGRVRATDCVIVNGSPAGVATLLGDSAPPQYGERLATLEPSLSCLTLYLALDRPVDAIGGPADYMIVDAPARSAEALYARAAAASLDDAELTIVAHGAAGAVEGIPAGRGQLAVAALTEGRAWQDASRTAYRERKARAVETLMARVERWIPGVRSHVTAMATGTPRTNARFTGNPAGAIYGYLKDVAQSSRVRPLSRTPIEGLYVASAWTFPGGGYSGAVWAGTFCVYENALLPVPGG